MKKKHMQYHVFITALILTILIFVAGVLVNYSLDFVRLGMVKNAVDEHDLSIQSYYLEQEFHDVFPA